MAKRQSRQIVRIDEALCNGCGVCISGCAEGAIEIVEGKAHVLEEALCDGAGFCLGVCPTGALTIETRPATPFDRDLAEARAADRPAAYVAQTCFMCGVSEDEVPLLPVRSRGSSAWCCTGCLPALIHRIHPDDPELS